MAKTASIGKTVRKRLSDITNSQSHPRLVSVEENQKHDTILWEDYVNRLLKENLTLINLLAERNKIIEMSGAELQKLRVNFQKLQVQNWNLAQAHSMMLAELNQGRERIKTLQHEFACKDAALKCKELELQGSTRLSCPNVDSKKANAAEESLDKANAAELFLDNDKCNDKFKRNKKGSSRSQSLGSLTIDEQWTEKEKTENKRRCLRRQSARFESQNTEAMENLFEIEDVKLAVGQKVLNSSQKDGTIKGEKKDEIFSPNSRSSLGRPLRRAVTKVQSYKEIPLNIKMRREQ